MSNVTIDIIMPVLNAEQYLAKAIESLQAQTHTNWRLIIMDDCSSDRSLAIAQNFAKHDPRIEVHQTESQVPTSAVASAALQYVTSQYLARMDADDIAEPHRLELQLAYLQAHPECIAVGGQCQLIDATGQVIGEKRFPTDVQAIYDQMFYALPVQQPTLLFNRALLPKDFVWYAPDVHSGEEHELMFKLLQFGEIHNVPDFLLKYRLHGQNVTLKDPKRDFFVIYQSRLRAVELYGYKPTLKGRLLNILQLLIVRFIPSKLLYPLFYAVRASKRNLFQSISLLFRLPYQH
jgi:glycosyltransferase involved in cell wall biosynthesis